MELNKKNKNSTYESRKEELNQKGLRHTKQRDFIFKMLVEKQYPISASDIYSKLAKKNIKMDLSTVYRILEALEDHGLARKIVVENESSAFYEYAGNGHKHYLICLGCKTIRSIEHCPLASYELSLSLETDFVIEGHSLIIYGYCPACSVRLNKDE